MSLVVTHLRLVGRNVNGRVSTLFTSVAGVTDTWLNGPSHRKFDNQMHEIDFLAVGEKTKTGDAIAMRFTRPDTGAQAVVVIDGGFLQSGTQLADLIRNRYGTETVDLMVCTHPDDDHIKGLFSVLDELDVVRLLIHRPKQYGYNDADNSKASLVEELVAKAAAKGVIIDDDSWAGTSYFGGALVMAGPTKDFYTDQLRLQAERVSESALVHAGRSVFEAAASVIKAAGVLLTDPGETLLTDNGGTTPRNNSSIILDLQVDDTRVLFTGDAGAPALEAAADKLDELGRSAKTIDVFDIPHHGSRHNLTRDLVNRLLGFPTDLHRGTAIASVGKEAHDHPRPSVANALKRRGFLVTSTRGNSIWRHSPEAPDRPDYGPVTYLDWLDESDEASDDSAA